MSILQSPELANCLEVNEEIYTSASRVPAPISPNPHQYLVLSSSLFLSMMSSCLLLADVRGGSLLKMADL